MSPPTRVIINADDFGLHPSINAAVGAAFERGVVTSCSLMPPDGTPQRRAGFDEAVSIARELPGLGVGLHLSLVGGHAQPAGYSLFLQAYCCGRYPSAQLAVELERQIDLVERAGIHPDHIDSHQHLHALPAIMRVVCDVAARRGIAAVRLPLQTGPIGARSLPGRRAASRALGLFAAVSRRIVDRSALWRPDCFMGMAVSGHLNEHLLASMISAAPNGGATEILCHPGADNADLSRSFDWGYDWEGELAAVTSAPTKDAVGAGVLLSSFRGAAQQTNAGQRSPVGRA